VYLTTTDAPICNDITCDTIAIVSDLLNPVAAGTGTCNSPDDGTVAVLPGPLPLDATVQVQQQRTQAQCNPLLQEVYTQAPRAAYAQNPHDRVSPEDYAARLDIQLADVLTLLQQPCSDRQQPTASGLYLTSANNPIRKDCTCLTLPIC
jgi:hypothetical protein